MNDQNILIELDALLDTRLGALSQISTDACAALMHKGYWERDSDNFGDQLEAMVTNEAYQEAYAKRGEDLTVLQASALTNMPQFLGPMTRTLQANAIRKVDVDKIMVTINIWPYPLQAHECDALAESLRPYVSLGTDVKVVSHSPEELTPGLLVDRYDMYIIYNFDDWDMAQRDNLMKRRIPEFTMMIPQLFKKVPTREDLLTEEGDELDPFKVFQLLLLEFIGIEIQPVFFYSIIRP